MGKDLNGSGHVYWLNVSVDGWFGIHTGLITAYPRAALGGCVLCTNDMTHDLNLRCTVATYAPTYGYEACDN